MADYSGPEDTYRELVEESDENWLYGLVAFAVIEEQRIEWMRHQFAKTGQLPGPEAIRDWYQQQPDGVILRAKGTAESALRTYSEEVLEIALEDQKRQVEEGVAVGEIRDLKRFWPQFGVNVAGGLASAILFSATLILLAFLLFNSLSPSEIGKELKNRLEVIDNGEAK